MKKLLFICLAILSASLCFAEEDTKIGLITSFGYTPTYNSKIGFYNPTTNEAAKGQEILGEVGLGGYSTEENLDVGIFFGVGMKHGILDTTDNVWTVNGTAYALNLSNKSKDIYALTKLDLGYSAGIFSLGTGIGWKTGFKRLKFTGVDTEDNTAAFKQNTIYISMPLEPYLALTFNKFRIAASCEYDVDIGYVKFITNAGETKPDFGFFSKIEKNLTAKVTVALFFD